jgi:hypothetical protein
VSVSKCINKCLENVSSGVGLGWFGAGRGGGVGRSGELRERGSISLKTREECERDEWLAEHTVYFLGSQSQTNLRH